MAKQSSFTKAFQQLNIEQSDFDMIIADEGTRREIFECLMFCLDNVPSLAELSATLIQYITDYDFDYDGGPGSGNFGHAGVPGQIGGSAGKGVSGLTRLNPDNDFTMNTTFLYAIHDLRTGEPLNEREKKIVEEADKAMEPISDDTVLYRGSTDKIEKGVFSKEEMQQWKSHQDVADSWVGKEFSDAGYMYTSDSKEATRQYTSDYELVITAKKGTKAVLGNGKAGNEIILARGTKFRCTSASTSSGRIILELETIC